jgi:hypothetical protein
LVLLFSCVGFSASAEQSNLTPAEQYAAYIDSLDWPSYDNHVDMINAAQIPEYILNQMSTEDLVEAFLNYPLSVDLIAWNSYGQGFDAVKSQFNGLDELVNREDGAQKLLEKLQSFSAITKFDVNSRSFDSSQYMHPYFLEVLLAQPEFMNQFTEEETEEAIAIIDGIIEQRDPEIYGDSAYRFYQAANEQIETYYYMTVVATPGGNYAEAKVRGTGDVEIDIESTTDFYISQYPNANFRRTATNRYNCHSYAWYSQAINNYWINNCEPYLNDGTCHSTGEFKVGTRVVYYDSTLSANGFSPYGHSALVQPGSPSRYVVSKWSEGPLMEHTMSYCPYYNSNVTLYYYNY